MYVLEQDSVNFSVKILSVWGFVGSRVHCNYSTLLLQYESSHRVHKYICVVMNTES